MYCSPSFYLLFWSVRPYYIFCSFLIGLFLYYWIWELSIYSSYIFYIRYVSLKYCLPVCGLSFHFLLSIFRRVEVMNDFLQSESAMVNSFLIQIQKPVTSGKNIKPYTHTPHTYTHIRMDCRKGRKALMMHESEKQY